MASRTTTADKKSGTTTKKSGTAAKKSSANGNGPTSRKVDAGFSPKSRPANVPAMLSQDEALKKLAAIQPLTTSALELPDLTEQWLMFDLEATTPLLTNRFSDISLDEIEAKQAGIDFVRPPRDPQADMMQASHIIEGHRAYEHKDTNRYGLTAIGLKKSMARAIFKAGLQDNMLNTSLFTHVDGPYNGLVSIEAPPPILRRDYVVLGRGTKSQKTSLCYRPEFATWRAQVYISYYPLLVSIGNVMMAVKLAGSLVGVGSFRKENWGDFGLFRIIKISALDVETGWWPPHYTVTETGGVITNVEVDPIEHQSKRQRSR